MSAHPVHLLAILVRLDGAEDDELEFKSAALSPQPAALAG
jgi:hypothetical protein